MAINLSAGLRAMESNMGDLPQTSRGVAVSRVGCSNYEESYRRQRKLAESILETMNCEGSQFDHFQLLREQGKLRVFFRQNGEVVSRDVPVMNVQDVKQLENESYKKLQQIAEGMFKAMNYAAATFDHFQLLREQGKLRVFFRQNGGVVSRDVPVVSDNDAAQIELACEYGDMLDFTVSRSTQPILTLKDGTMKSPAEMAPFLV